MTPFGQRILILAPHPDDEVVGACAAIQRAKKNGADVSVLFLSHGCLAKHTLWPWERKHYEEGVARRMLEAQLVAEYLAFTILETNCRAGEMLRAAREIWCNLPTIWQEVNAAIAAVAPDCLWVPAYEGGNPDHDALNAVASRIKNVPVFEMAEYHFADGKEHVGVFIAEKGNETIIALTAEEQAAKRHALAMYASEKGNLKYFGGMKTECLRPLLLYDYDAPPHKGTLWYQRYQWVPFKHPRVDFTKPHKVSEAIKDFLNGHV